MTDDTLSKIAEEIGEVTEEQDDEEKSREGEEWDVEEYRRSKDEYDGDW